MLSAAAFCAKILYLAYCRTLTIRVINPRFSPQRMPPGSNAVYVVWHSKIFLSMLLLRGSRTGVFALPGWRGHFWGKLCASHGLRSVPFLSEAQATLTFKRLLAEGSPVVLGADSPAGPAGTIKPGAVYLARKSKKPIVAMSMSFERSIRIESRWDRLEIPLPFSRATFTFGEPLDAGGRDFADLEPRLRELLGPY